MPIAIQILIAALMVGLASDLLFHDSIVHSVPNGVSIVIWSLSISMGVCFLVAAKRHEVKLKSLWWLLPFNLSGAAYVWRDSPTLHGLDVFLMFFSLVMLSFSLKGKIAQASGTIDYLQALFVTGVDALIEAVPLCRLEIPWRRIVPPSVSNNAPALARGIAIAVPILLLFGSLFVMADAAFAGLLNQALNLNISEVVVHATIFTAFTWCTAGYLRPLFVTAREAGVVQSETSSLRPLLGRLELNVVLALVNLLFLSFVLVQFRYFFGGASMVDVAKGLSYAEYARRGFFELTTVTALVLPLLLVADWFLPRHKDKHDKIFPVQAAFQICLLFVIMSSAIQRMNLYQDMFGLTELRFYTSAFIGLMAVVYLIFAATVLTGKRSKFAFSACLAGLAATACVQICNPDRLITAVNIENARLGKPFDAHYALSLSNDATAYLVQNIGKLPVSSQREIAANLIPQEQHAWHYDFRSFNLARYEAYQAVHDNLPLLNAISAASLTQPQYKP